MDSQPSTSRGGIQRENTPKYLVKSQLLRAFGAPVKEYEFKEILRLLKAYLFKNRSLIDPHHPHIVNCEGTDLGEALGVDKFEYDEVRYLLMRHITRVPTKLGSANQSISTIPCISNSRNSKVRSGIIIPFPEIPDSDSGPESDHSYQGYVTALCTYSDTSERSDEDSDVVEYEVVTDNEKTEQVDSDSDVENLLVIFGIENGADGNESEENFFADGSDSSSGSDSSPEGLRDEWPCLTCGNDKNTPFFSYCQKCWQVRRDWYPDRPKRRHKRKPRPKDKRKRSKRSMSQQNVFCDSEGFRQNDMVEAESLKGKVQSEDTLQIDGVNEESSQRDEEESGSPFTLERESSVYSTISVSSASSTSSSSQDSGFGASSVDAAPPPPPTRKRRLSDADESACKARRLSRGLHILDKKRSAIRRFLNTPEGKCWLRSEHGRDLLDQLSKFDHSGSDSGAEVEPEEGNCILCCSRPENASIIHGRISHLGFCYPCAKKLHNSNSRCPICRRKIHMVTKNTYA